MPLSDWFAKPMITQSSPHGRPFNCCDRLSIMNCCDCLSIMIRHMIFARAIVMMVAIFKNTLVWCKTDPAERALASSASHMITTFVFLNMAPAARTLFSEFGQILRGRFHRSILLKALLVPLLTGEILMPRDLMSKAGLSVTHITRDDWSIVPSFMKLTPRASSILAGHVVAFATQRLLGQ